MPSVGAGGGGGGGNSGCRKCGEDGHFARDCPQGGGGGGGDNKCRNCREVRHKLSLLTERQMVTFSFPRKDT